MGGESFVALLSRSFNRFRTEKQNVFVPKKHPRVGDLSALGGELTMFTRLTRYCPQPPIAL